MTNTMKAERLVILKPGREAPTMRRHPWIFSGSITMVQGNPGPGDLVAVYSAEGDQLAWGHYSPASQIRIRLFSWAQDIPDGAGFWRQRLQRALGLRESLRRSSGTTAYRLVNAESDGIPGLIVDQYGDVIVIQLLTAGTDALRDTFADLLMEMIAPLTIYERSDVDVRGQEGLLPVAGLLRGVEPPPLVDITELGLTYRVDIRNGHKTGFYLDQRENRQRFRALAATQDQSAAPVMLNVFSYTGAFSVCGLAAGMVRVVNIDASEDALALGQRNVAANGYDSSRVTDIQGDAFVALRKLRQQSERFDLIVLDPPKFASAQRDVQRASRGYKDINLQAFHLLKPGGTLTTFSCSGAISEDLFQKIVFGAALDAGRDIQITGRLSQGSDHPVALTFPEGAYLKGLTCRAVE